MTENKKIPENAENKPLTDEQLSGVTGGEDLSLSAMPIIYLIVAYQMFLTLMVLLARFIYLIFVI